MKRSSLQRKSGLKAKPATPKSYEQLLAAARAAEQRRTSRQGRAGRRSAPSERPTRVQTPKRPSKSSDAPRSRRPEIPKGTKCVCGCGKRAVHWHHGLRESMIERHGGDVWSPLVIVPVAAVCHYDAHWSAFRRMDISVLPDSVFAFAFELMGPAAYDELRRAYDGDDPRLDALLR